MVNRNYQIRGGVPQVYMIYGEPESSNEGGGLFNTYHEPLSPNVGGVFNMYVEPLSPIERDLFKIQDDPELPNKGACFTTKSGAFFRYMVQDTK